MKIDYALLTDLYQLTMAQGYWETGQGDTQACFHMYFRDYPFKGGYAIACGMAQLADLVDEFSFSDEDVAYLGSLDAPGGGKLFKPEFLDYLRTFELRVDIDAVLEGTVVFPHEPLVRVTGPIMDIDAQLRWIDKLGRMPGVKGVLVRVDSPGGGAAASQELYEALARLGKDKPIAVSMGSTAASGGLMVSMAGTRVFANASTVTGSIGVRMDIPQIRGLLDKLGLGRQTLTTAPYKDAGSMLEPLTAEEKAYFQGVLKDMHEQFVDIVAQGRHMDRARAARLATGKIFTGREAVELGLVDELGGQQAAHRWLADVCKVPVDQPLLTPPSEDEWWEKSLKTWFGLDADALLSREAPAFLYSF